MILNIRASGGKKLHCFPQFRYIFLNILNIILLNVSRTSRQRETVLGWNTVFRCSLKPFWAVLVFLFRSRCEYSARMDMGHGHGGAVKAP